MITIHSCSVTGVAQLTSSVWPWKVATGGCDLRSDPDVKGIELDIDVMLPEAPPGLRLNQSTASILDMLGHRTLVPFYGSPVLSSYVNQPAVVLIRSAEAHQLATGAGIVAVIDTGTQPSPC